MQDKYPLTFLFFDAECQMVFHEGERLPKMVYNYLHQAESTNTAGYTTEAAIPAIVDLKKRKSGDNEVWEITVNNPNSYPFPMGIAEWGDFSTLATAGQSENVKEIKHIGDQLLFVRCDAQAAGNSVFILEFTRP